MHEYSKITHDIEVTVIPLYLEQHSDPEESHFVWSYQVRIENHGHEVTQLINRYWHITDAHGIVKEVRGPGVVGEQPTLHPGESFEYASGTYLSTPSGIMVGTYEMLREDGSMFDIDIPAFSLDSDEQVARPN